MQPRDHDWAEFYGHMLASSGLNLAEYKAPQLQRRTLNMMESKSCHSLSEFWDWIAADRANLQWYMDKLAINVSELFRNPEKWSGVEAKIVPELLESTSTIKAWSAGCSYGAEAYTLAMILAENFKAPFQIVGTDIDEEAMARADKGFFDDRDVRYVPPKYQQYLVKGGRSWTVHEGLRRHVTFKSHNLLADRFDTGFDVIMCRNVVIYFTDQAKDGLYRRFFEALRPGGYLFVGGTERIFKSAEMGYETAEPFFYRRPRTEARTWQNAS